MVNALRYSTKYHIIYYKILCVCVCVCVCVCDIYIYIYILFVYVDGWNRHQYPFNKLDFGKWEIKLSPAPDGTCVIAHNSVVKVLISINFIIKKNKAVYVLMNIYCLTLCGVSYNIYLSYLIYTVTHRQTYTYTTVISAMLCFKYLIVIHLIVVNRR